MKRTLLALAVLATTPFAAQAHDTTPIEREMASQYTLIKDYRRTGDLTRIEYRRLVREQNTIDNLLRQARSDGYVNGREFRHICNVQEAARENINREASDWQYSRFRRWLARYR